MDGLIRTDAEIAADEAQDEYESYSRVWQVRDAREHGFTLAIQAMRVLAGEAFARREVRSEDTCQRCHGTGAEIVCVDDMCVGADECFHGDGEVMCRECDGWGSVDVEDNPLLGDANTATRTSAARGDA